ncbi:MAG: hypothetical protein IJ054_01905 [Lachnospiraceae bacterium]|nr:hypothetical protein [Lachnospiraceae bacterium]MBQ9608687.1 hypothetical protein [Lachnospiraceae bacterium]
MENGAVIRSRLDLLIRLTDTTTGQAINSQSVEFWKDGKQLLTRPRGDGNYIFVDMGRDNSLMKIIAPGYDPQEFLLDYETLDERMPSIDIFLIPSENNESVLTLSGKMRGLKQIEAVQLGKPVCSISEFNPKDNKLSLFLPNRQMNLEGGHYGILHGEKDYEHFIVKEQTNRTTVRLKEKLNDEVAVGNEIYRIVFGNVDSKGNYILRVRDTADKLRYLVRFQTDDKLKYRVYSFEGKEVFEEKT